MNTSSEILFTPFNLSGKVFKNRVVKAPLTRNRAVHGTDAPQALKC